MVNLKRPLHELLGEQDQEVPWEEIPAGIQATYVAEAAVAIWADGMGLDIFKTLWEFRGNEHMHPRSDFMEEAYRETAELTHEWLAGIR